MQIKKLQARLARVWKPRVSSQPPPQKLTQNSDAGSSQPITDAAVVQSTGKTAPAPHSPEATADARSARDKDSDGAEREPFCIDRFARLYGDRVTAESTARAQAKWVRYCTTWAKDARVELSAALQAMQKAPHPCGTPHNAANRYMFAAIKKEAACSASLKEATEEYSQSYEQLTRAQGAFAEFLLRYPAESLAAHRKLKGDTHLTKRNLGKAVIWPSDDELEALKLIPHRHDADDAWWHVSSTKPANPRG